MASTRNRKLGVLAVLSLFGGEALAQAMPALRVDPTLLGLPPLPPKESAATPPSTPVAPAAGTAVVTPIAKESLSPASPVIVPAAGTAVVPAQATAAASATGAPAVGQQSAAAPAKPMARQSLPPLPPRPRPRGVGSPAATATATATATQMVRTDTATSRPATKLPPLRVDPGLLGPGFIAQQPASPRAPAASPPVAVAAASTRRCYPMPAAAILPTEGGKSSSGGKLPPLRVDPALLGGAPVASTPAAPGMVMHCDDEPTQLAGSPSTRRAAGVPLSKLSKDLPRIPLGNPDETSILADSIRGNNETEVIAEGNVELTKNDALLETDYLVFRQPLDEVEAIGNVRLSRDTEEMVGSYMKLQIKDRVGYFDQPQYVIQRSVIGGSKKSKAPTPLSNFDLPEPKPKAPSAGRGEAARLHFEGEGSYRLEDSTFSTCQPNKSGSLDWYTQVADLKLDYNTGRGVGKHTTIYFKDVPILYTPYLDFSLDNERKSGLLSPSIGTSTNNGFEYTQPIYWNIAPNMDATFAPHLMSKRGIQLRNEFRYLQPSYAGQLRFEYLAKDKLTEEARHAYSFTHQQAMGNGFSSSLQLNGVSDDNYFKDLDNNSIAASSNNLILSQGTLNYGGSWWSAALTAQDYQVLQDIENPVAAPYARMPQLTVSAARADLPLGLQFNFAGEMVRFAGAADPYFDPVTTRLRMAEKQEGTRRTLYPQLSLPLLTSYFYLTPKIGYHLTDYSLDTWTNEQTGAKTPGSSISRRAPIYSVDSGLTFERPSTFGGQAMTQTLEPRLYYVRIPYREQDQLPLFDTGLADFNFAQIFSENRFAGGDRLGDANQLTAMATTRWIEPDTGAERLRVAAGQRFYFADQKVNLPAGTTDTQRKSDLLGAISGQVLPRLFADGAIQYSQTEAKTLRYSAGVRYQPEIGKILSGSYRYADRRFTVPNAAASTTANEGLRQIDVSGQWPLGGGWYGVGRYNYSIQERRLIESIGGLEYDAGCWIVRGVARRAGTAENDTKSSFFVQLELKDFSRIGSNPLSLLKRSVPGYREINTLDSDPTFAVQ